MMSTSQTMSLLARRALRYSRRSAFTLLEVLIVVAILVVLAGVSSIYVFRYLDDAKRDRVKADVRTLTTACEAYMRNNDGNPPQSLAELVQPPDNRKPYLPGPEALLDPWGKEYQYNPAGPRNRGLKPDIWTVTPENEEIGNWGVATAGS